MRFEILVQDNARTEDASHRWPAGSFGTAHEAVRAAGGIIDNSLQDCFRPGDTADTLFERWRRLGDLPLVMGLDGEGFDGEAYARRRTAAMVGDVDGAPDGP